MIIIYQAITKNIIILCQYTRYDQEEEVKSGFNKCLPMCVIKYRRVDENVLSWILLNNYYQFCLCR